MLKSTCTPNRLTLANRRTLPRAVRLLAAGVSDARSVASRK